MRLIRRNGHLHDVHPVLDLERDLRAGGLVFYVAQGIFVIEYNAIPFAVIFEAAARGFRTWGVA